MSVSSASRFGYDNTMLFGLCISDEKEFKF